MCKGLAVLLGCVELLILRSPPYFTKCALGYVPNKEICIYVIRDSTFIQNSSPIGKLGCAEVFGNSSNQELFFGIFLNLASRWPIEKMITTKAHLIDYIPPSFRYPTICGSRICEFSPS